MILVALLCLSQALTLKYHTSKIKGFNDLSSLSTFGFRGEALSSLCAVSQLAVITRTAEQEVSVRGGVGPRGSQEVSVAGRKGEDRAVEYKGRGSRGLGERSYVQCFMQLKTVGGRRLDT